MPQQDSSIKAILSMLVHYRMDFNYILCLLHTCTTPFQSDRISSHEMSGSFLLETPQISEVFIRKIDS